MDAAQTKRGSKLSDLIRSGSKGAASVRIFLTNEGENAYYPKEFGDEIIVERIIYPDASSKYKISNARTNTFKPKSKKDIMELVEKFDLHVDNPCCVLDQENAKLFLKGTSREKYLFFLRGTGL